jgi:energy-coupling factor transporter ATP-binding protein EcfA2
MVTPADNPISDPADDLLGRIGAAQDLASQIQSLDASDGYVLAVTGPWGSGKTSLVNLVKHELERNSSVPVVDFNPWMFSGAEQLVEAFFTELSAQLKLKPGRIGAVAGEIEAYGELLSPLSILPFVGSWIDRVRGAGSALRRFQERRRESVTARRATLASKLRELDTPILVAIDDTDRLRTDEIRDVFKLVRLTASFPNIIYLLAFDRSRVEVALTESGIDGRSYLEKIVQVAVDVPAIPQEALLRHITQSLDDVLSDLGEPVSFDKERWPDVLMEIIRPLIRNVRDIRRYAASVRGTARTLHKQIELVDLLALEAVRAFLPDVFTALVKAQEGLTKIPSSYGGRDVEPHLKQSVDDMVAVAKEHGDVARALISRLFPAAQRYIENMHYGPEWPRTWLKARRVAHIDLLRLYLERTASEGLSAFSDAERAYALLADEGQLDEFLRSIDLARLEDVIAALENYEDEYPVESVVPATAVLLNLLPELPERPRGMMTLDTRLVVGRVVLRLLRRLPGPAEAEAAVTDIMPGVKMLSSKLELVTTVGYRDGAGHELVSREFAGSLEGGLDSEIRAATADQLLQEWDLLGLLLAPSHWDEGAPPVLGTSSDPQVNAKILTASRNEVRSRTMGNRAVRRTYRLSWDALIKLYGGEDQLRAAIESVRPMTDSDEQLAKTIELADKYLTGWRPERAED